MKKFQLLLTAISLAIFANNSFAAEAKYAIEPFHTSVTWKANHLGFSNPTGKFSEVEGFVVFDEKAPAKSSVDVTIKLNSINTGIAKFDDHLKSKDFFDVSKNTTAKFVSTKVLVTGKNKAKITGDLTLLGVTKPVTLNVIFNKAGVSAITNKDTVGFSATTSILRSDFGINYALPAVADKVDLMIEVEANR